MIKQSNLKFQINLPTKYREKKTCISNFKHFLLVFRHEIDQKQETNLNLISNKESSSYCSLIETSLKNQTLFTTTDTKNNLNKLQKITDDVKFLTKQLQLSVNQNNNASSTFTLG